MAEPGPSHGGPDSSTAPPGSTVMALPPGNGGTVAMTSVSRSQVGASHRIGQVEAVRLDLEADLADGAVAEAFVRRSCSAASEALESSAVSGLSPCSPEAVVVMSTIPSRVRTWLHPQCRHPSYLPEGTDKFHDFPVTPCCCVPRVRVRY